MDIAFFSTRKFELELIKKENSSHVLKLLEARLSIDTATLAQDCTCISLFVNDDASALVLEKLYEVGVRHIVLRSAGHNHVDLSKCKELGISVANVPEYSPNAVAEHTIALMMALNRKLIRANNRVKDLNFSLDGLTGFDMNKKTVGIIGTGKIGLIVAKILNGFGCSLLGYDTKKNKEAINKYGLEYTSVDDICHRADIITLHVPLNDATRYMIDGEQVAKMKKGVMLINTSRGGLINTREIISALKTGHIGYLGLDVYEEEKDLFFEDHSEDILQDDVIARLLTFKNVLITSHQGFLTDTALKNIVETTFYNINCLANEERSKNELTH